MQVPLFKKEQPISVDAFMVTNYLWSFAFCLGIYYIYLFFFASFAGKFRSFKFCFCWASGEIGQIAQTVSFEDLNL